MSILADRVCNYKLQYCEDDIRKRNGISGVYLDPEGKYFVPNPLEIPETGYHWDLSHETRKELVHNQGQNQVHNGGGILSKLQGNRRFLIIGGGKNPSKPKIRDAYTIGVGRSLEVDGLDCYVCNHPGPECLQWKSQQRRKPIGLFSLGVYPKFINSYRGLKYFYGSGWEAGSAPLYLMDLLDPISVVFSLLHKVESCEEVILCNTLLYFEESRPGCVDLNGFFMYPQQIMSLSLLQALIFWARRSGIALYSLDSILSLEAPKDILN